MNGLRTPQFMVQFTTLNAGYLYTARSYWFKISRVCVFAAAVLLLFLCEKTSKHMATSSDFLIGIVAFGKPHLPNRNEQRVSNRVFCQLSYSAGQVGLPKRHFRHLKFHE